MSRRKVWLSSSVQNESLVFLKRIIVQAKFKILRAFFKRHFLGHSGESQNPELFESCSEQDWIPGGGSP